MEKPCKGLTIVHDIQMIVTVETTCYELKLVFLTRSKYLTIKSLKISDLLIKKWQIIEIN